MADAAPVTIIVAKITGMLTLGLVGTKPLTKPVVKKGDALAIIGAYAADPKFGKYSADADGEHIEYRSN